MCTGGGRAARAGSSGPAWGGSCSQPASKGSRCPSKPTWRTRSSRRALQSARSDVAADSAVLERFLQNVGARVLHVPKPAKRHRHVELVADDLERACDAFFPQGAEAVEKGAAD